MKTSQTSRITDSGSIILSQNQDRSLAQAPKLATMVRLHFASGQMNTHVCHAKSVHLLRPDECHRNRHQTAVTVTSVYAAFESKHQREPSRFQRSYTAQGFFSHGVLRSSSSAPAVVVPVALIAS